ncbi:MAG: penicillin-binding protein 2 [Bacteroidales bacterium]|nr:penicillin-binding protein 2 [Bacteroidales bacterium]
MTDPYRNRSVIIRYIYTIVVVVLVIRLVFLQLINSDYKRIAAVQALREVTQYPARGYIYDREGKLLVYNEAVYDLMVIPDMTVKRYRNRHRQDSIVQLNDTALLCRKLGITHEDYESHMKKAIHYSWKAPSIFMKQISKEELAAWEGDLRKFNGFYLSRRTLRSYDRPIGAHVLGYVGEVGNRDIQADSYYKQGDYIGQSGLERMYEKELRGIKGKKVMHVDVNSREIGHYMDGALDSLPVSGNNLYTSLDADLQEYAERLMANKRGCVVAIEPSSGEVLALVSAPSYDPNLLVGRVRGKNYSVLYQDIRKPLFNRALQAAYPPGSIFKVAQAVTALQLGVIDPYSYFVCDHNLVGCHNHPTAMSVQEAIKMSCNPYFYRVYGRMIQQGKYKNAYKDSKYGLTLWRSYMMRFGFGQRMDIDLPNVMEGSIPDTSLYDKWYNHRWTFASIYSNSIGQGEVQVVPIQMANLACVVANRGYYYTPHVVRYIGNDTAKFRVEKYYRRHETGIERRYYDIAVAGMYDVVHAPGGTGHKADVPGIDVCGKTGTAQNKGADHSVFISFAPRDNPKIALAVYVENAPGGGGSWAAPISGLIIEKYLKGEVQRADFEKRYMDINPCQPVRPPKEKKP